MAFELLICHSEAVEDGAVGIVEKVTKETVIHSLTVPEFLSSKRGVAEFSAKLCFKCSHCGSEWSLLKLVPNNQQVNLGLNSACK
jgi:hypothetical protein